MKKDKYTIFLLMSLLLFYGCQDAKKGFSGKNIDEGEEFLVIKKNPLVVPPDFEKMPLPKNDNDSMNSFKAENNQDNEFKKLLKTKDKNTSASISKETKSITVEYFKNSALTKQPTLSQVLSEKLKDYFTEQTNLIISNQNGDLFFKGDIIKYDVQPIAIQSNETAGQNRLTISVKIDFINKQNEELNFNQTFSRYKDYESSQNLSEIEDILITEITNELVEDIFNKAVVNW
mgnify:CR=1 FL=1